MCLAAPSRVLEVSDGTALTECFGQLREVSLLLMNEDVAVGDYLLIQAGGFAFERVEPERAREALALMREFMEREGGAREWGDGLEAA
ncbi:MAG: HypC/HybG/HupF family hydrogenase formation chaperone [Betaproteobacteria bacterium]|nr:HypC/HybG/HupF family hydrogenase formation chaperone [Betaproteobacteria bacterium]